MTRKRIHRRTWAMLPGVLCFGNLILIHALIPHVLAHSQAVTSSLDAVPVARSDERPPVRPTAPAEKQGLKTAQNALDMDALWRAICEVESGGNPRAIGDGGDSCGIAQISTICLRDCNRIVGFQKWSENDRFSPAKSREIFDTYISHYEPDGDAEAIARLWNSGPRWASKKHLTDGYWEKVRKHL